MKTGRICLNPTKNRIYLSKYWKQNYITIPYVLSLYNEPNAADETLSDAVTDEKIDEIEKTANSLESYDNTSLVK